MALITERTPLVGDKVTKTTKYCEIEIDNNDEAERRASTSTTVSNADIDSMSIEKSTNTETTTNQPSKQGSVVTIFAVWSSMMGTSILAMPWAFQQAGLVQGIFLQMFVAGITGYTATLVLKASRYNINPVTGMMPEFAEVCQDILGRFGTIVTTLSSGVLFYGALIVYWILMSELLYNSVNSIDYFSTSPPANNTTVSTATQLDGINLDLLTTEKNNSMTNISSETCPSNVQNITHAIMPLPAWSETFTIPLFLIGVFAPLIMLRSPAFFTRFGAAGSVPIIYLIFYSVYRSWTWGVYAEFEEKTDIHYVRMFSGNFPVLSGLLSMGFFVHNAVVTLFKHSENQKKIGRDLGIAFFLVFLTYTIIGVSIFLSYPYDKQCIKQNFFENIPVTDKFSMIAQLMLFFRFITLFPLISYVLRVQIFVPATGSEYPGHLPVALLNLTIITLCVTCAMFIPNIGDIIRYAGAFCGMLYIFLLPCLIDTILEHRKEKSKGTKTNLCRHILHGFITLFGFLNFFAQFVVN